MKVIFLDVDGVLNSKETFANNKNNFENQINNKLLNNLKYIIDETKAEVILSSTWRYYFHNHPVDCFNRKLLENKLASIGVKIFDITPIYCKNCASRADEIKYWLNNTEEEIENFIVIDDNDDELSQFGEKFIHTSFEFGLTKELAQEAIKQL